MDNAIYSSRSIDLAAHAKAAAALPDLLISADSHATEPPELWRAIPPAIRDRLPPMKSGNPRPEGGTDPRARIADMDRDRLAAEVLFPDRFLGVFAAEQDVQEGAFAAYNDWVADYCRKAPKRLFAPVALSCYDIDQAIAELHRGHDMGLRGALIWEVPDPRLPFHSNHYEKLWAALGELGAPVNVHILTGFSDNKRHLGGIERIRANTDLATYEKITTVFDILWSGAFDRHPRLRLGLIESEIGWAPFMLQQWDYFFFRSTAPGRPTTEKLPIARRPSDIFREHVFATFIDDLVGTRMLDAWGERNCMWSSDYPHPNMTWPHSREYAARQIGDLPYPLQQRLLARNAIDFFGLPLL